MEGHDLEQRANIGGHPAPPCEMGSTPRQTCRVTASG
jgi:hypothetical protein